MREGGPLQCELRLGLGDAQAKAGEAPEYQQTFLQAAEIARRMGGAHHLAAAAPGYGGRFVWGPRRRKLGVDDA
jgi:hypothetical protein